MLLFIAILAIIFGILWGGDKSGEIETEDA
jgi:hypothetical protein